MKSKNLNRTGISEEIEQVVRELNPWWRTGRLRKAPPNYRRRGTPALISRISKSRGLIEVLRGPRQVGKTTAVEQAIQQLLKDGKKATDILFLRMDQELLRRQPGGLLTLVGWYEKNIRQRPFEKGAPAYIFLDEIHKLDRWDEDVKHLWDTYSVRVLITGSSSVLVSKGGRESLAGRTITTDFPTFQFREILEGWVDLSSCLPQHQDFSSLLSVNNPQEVFDAFRALQSQQKYAFRRQLERYYNRGGYPRLYNGDVDDDQWADYLTESVINRVLGIDVPDLFPIENPQLLRWIYVEVARSTGQEIAQARLAQDAIAGGYSTSQPVVGKYLHYLSDALLIREYRRYPSAKRTNSRMPSKLTLTDLGPRNAVFRGAPSLWESSPDHIGPLIETLVQSVVRGPSIQVHFFRDYENPKDRRTPMREIDFIAEDISGRVLPIEVKFRNRISDDDFIGLKCFQRRYSPPFSIMVTRDHFEWRKELNVLCVPLLEFLLAF